MTLSRAHRNATLAALTLALLSPGASAQGISGFLGRFGGGAWDMQTPAKLEGIPGRPAGYTAPPAQGPRDLYQGIPDQQVDQLPMPRLQRTWDFYQQQVQPRVQGVANFVRPLPGGQVYANNLMQNLHTPATDTYMRTAIPANLPATMQTMQQQPGVQYTDQARTIAGRAGATLTEPYTAGHWLRNSFARKGQEKARGNVLNSLGQVGAGTALFGARYWPSVANVPNYVRAGQAMFGGAGDAAGGAPAQDMPQ